MKKREGLQAPSAPHPPLAERGRMLSADDVLELLPRKAGGKPSKSRYWVMNQFLPQYRRKLGRTVYWWETDVVRHLDSEASA